MCRKVTDHHKGWTMCRIVREAVTKKLIVPFVRQELSGGNPNLTPSEFFKCIMLSLDPNYYFMADFVFELLDAIFTYRAGILE